MKKIHAFMALIFLFVIFMTYNYKRNQKKFLLVIIGGYNNEPVSKVLAVSAKKKLPNVL